MQELKVIAKRDEEILFESTNVESVLNWLITMLYDGHIKRAKIKIEQYYKDGKEYCKVISKYKDSLNEGKFLEYTVTGLRNEWGNYINMQVTLLENNIRIIKEK